MDQTTLEGFAITMKDIQDRKPPILSGLADFLTQVARIWNPEQCQKWASEVETIQRAITQLSEEE